MNLEPRNRVCGALIRDGRILMVRHQELHRSFWTLPGGGVEPDETYEEAVVREVLEETNLETSVVQAIWQDFDSETYSSESCFLLNLSDNSDSQASLGVDPEENHLPKPNRQLQEVAWRPLNQVREDIQVSRILAFLKI